MIRDSAGNLYGTCDAGGSGGAGLVYKLDAAGHETVLHNFTGGADGGNSNAGVIHDSAGNLYGTTTNGGTANAGVVYKLDAAGNETVLYSFKGQADGSFPFTGVVRDSTGNLYGTTQQGGSANLGVVFKLDTSGQETVLHSFTGPADGSVPSPGVFRDSAGNLYGTTGRGGKPNAGVVYKLDTTGHETVLYTFTGGADGGNPYAGVIRDPAGNLYGTTYDGGAYGYGVVYKLDQAGSETVLYSFTGGTDGGNPVAGVILDPQGNLYGTTFRGGAANVGVVYELDAAGQQMVLHSFTLGSDGGFPQTALIRDSAGNLYGTTANGGSGAGVVYKLDTAGQETVLHTFTGGADGSYPNGLVRDGAGNLYGTAALGGSTAFAGVLYKLDTTGQETVLHTFTGGADGGLPNGLVRSSAGNFYVTTQSGGTGNQGVVVKFDTAGHETVLHNFTGGADGGNPNPGVILDSAGNLYGTAQIGGSANTGVLYQLNPQ